MTLQINIPDESAELLSRRAAALGISVEKLVENLAREKANSEEGLVDPARAQAAAERIREIRKRVKPDPEGWTIRDYIDYGRR
ncbi:MAG: ribbon-helix-helix protein, CopG family [Bryobacterales bacterium]|nr:ribbon-helix-helix protein, CopG family [Bryobacterales bacterium]